MDPYIPIVGKTYTLFGRERSTRGFYKTVSSLVDQILQTFSWDEKELLGYLRSESTFRKNPLKNQQRPGRLYRIPWPPAIPACAVNFLIVYLSDRVESFEPAGMVFPAGVRMDRL